MEKKCEICKCNIEKNDWYFCPICGKDLRNSHENIEEPSKKSMTKSITLAIVSYISFWIIISFASIFGLTFGILLKGIINL